MAQFYSHRKGLEIALLRVKQCLSSTPPLWFGIFSLIRQQVADAAAVAGRRTPRIMLHGSNQITGALLSQNRHGFVDLPDDALRLHRLQGLQSCSGLLIEAGKINRVRNVLNLGGWIVDDRTGNYRGGKD